MKWHIVKWLATVVGLLALVAAFIVKPSWITLAISCLAIRITAVSEIRMDRIERRL